jgi:hypothetical protein
LDFTTKFWCSELLTEKELGAFVFPPKIGNVDYLEAVRKVIPEYEYSMMLFF